MRMPLSTLVGAIAIAILLAPAPVVAQDAVERTRIQLEMTDHRIGQAEVLVMASDHELAQVEFGRATEIQARARSEFGAERYRIALDLTLRARGHADRVIALIRGLPDPDRVGVQLERTRELLDRARQRIEECDNDRALAMLRAALDMQVRAETAGQEGRYLAALQLTMSARERALRALRLCDMEEDLRETAERAMHRTDDVIERARDAVDDRGDERARETLARAVGLQERALAEFRADRLEACLRLTNNARAFAFRAIRMSGRS